MTERSVHASVRSMLMNNEPFDYCHLIKFERPSRPDSLTGKVSTSKERYTYISDASIDITFDDGSSSLSGVTNGPQTYIANKVISVSPISEEIEAVASNFSLQLDGTSLGATISATVTTSVVSTGVYDVIFPASADLIDLGFREGDKVTITGITEPGDYNITGFRINNTLRLAKIDTTLFTPQTSVSITMSLASEEITSVLVDKTASGYSSFLNREVYVWKAFFQEGTMIGTPILIFKGLISNSSFEDGDSNIKVTWGLTSHWGDWAQVAGRITSDDFHRALDENGNPNPLSSLKPLYAYDKGFSHAETSVNILSKYTTMVEKQDITVKKGFFGLTSKVKVRKYLAPEDHNTQLDFQLQAKSIPVIYGVRPVSGIPIFADTLKTDSSSVYVAYALSEGEVSSIYDVYIDGNSLICSNKADYDVRYKQNTDNTVPLVCIGRADRGDVLGGSVATTTSTTSYYANDTYLYDFGYNLIDQINFTPYTAPVTTSAVTPTGLKDGETLTLSSPQRITLDFFSGKEAQKAAQSLVNIAKNDNFKIQNDYWTGTDTSEYWGPNHRLLDTAYVVAQYKISEGETTIPDLQFILNGKVIPCYNYDYSYSQYNKATGESASNFKLGDTVDLYRADTNVVINSSVQIIDKWTFYTPDGVANVRFRFNADPSLGYVNGVPSITKFYMKSGVNTWTMVSYNYQEHSGSPAAEISSTLSSATSSTGKLTFNFATNVNITYGGDPLEASAKFSILTTSGGLISNEKFGSAILSGVDTSTSLITEMDYATSSAYASAAISGNKLVSRNTIKLAATASATNDYYTGSRITVVRTNSITGKQVTQIKNIIAYDGTNKVATIDGVWDIYTIPTTTDTYYINQKYIDHRVSTNFAIQALDYVTSTTYGRGLSIDNDIDLASWMQAARDCDARSDVTVRLASGTAPTVGDIYKLTNTAGAIVWQGTVSTSFTSSAPGSATTFVTFTSIIGKLSNQWNSWKVYNEGEFVYYGNNIYKVATGYAATATAPTHTVGTVSNLAYLSSVSIAKVSGAGSATLALYPTGNPVQGIKGGRLASGYSLYDSDGIDYWRYVGWDASDQRYVTRHQGNLSIDTSSPVFDNINTILSHFGGMLRYSSGKYYLDVETSAPTITNASTEPYNITEDQLIDKISLTDEGIRSSYNSLSVSYADPSNKFEARNISFFNSEYLKADRNVPRKGNLSIPGITNYYNARLLADKYLNKSRFGLVINITIAPRGMLLVAGQIIQLQYSRYNWVNKKFRIESLTIKEDGLVSIMAREYDSSFYTASNISKQEGSGLAGTPVTAAFPSPSNLSATQTVNSDDTSVTINLTWTNNVTSNSNGTDIEIYAAAKDLTVTTTSSTTLTTSAIHNLAINDPVIFFSALYGLVAGVTYYVASVPTTSTFTLKDITDAAISLGTSTGLSIKCGAQKLLDTISYPISKYSDIVYNTLSVNKYYRIRNKIYIGSSSTNYSPYHPLPNAPAVLGTTTGTPTAITGYLTKESVTLAATNAGVVSDFTPASGNFKVLLASTDITTGNGVVYSVGTQTACTVSIDSSTGAYSVSALTADNGSAVLQATYGSVIITKVLTLAKAKSGTSGTLAVDISMTKNSATVYAYAEGTVPSWSNIDGFVKVYSGGSDVTAAATFSATPSSGLTGTVNTADNTPVSGQVKGYYRVTGLTSDDGTLTISVVYNSVTYTKIFTVSKVKTGYEILGAFPSTNLFVGRMVFLTTDNKLYKYTGSAWTAAVAAVDITGQLTDTQLAAIAATKVTGQLTNAQLADLAATKITGQITTTQITDGGITTAKIASNAITADKITITSTENLLINGDFASGGLDGWTRVVQLGGTASIASSADWPSFYGVLLNKTSAAEVSISSSNGGSFDDTNMRYGIASDLNDEYLFNAIIYYIGTGIPNVQALIRTNSTSLGYLTATPIVNSITADSGSTLVANCASNGFYQITGSFKNSVGRGKVYLRLQAAQSSTSGYCYFWNVSLKRKSAGSLIVDGAITASKITAATITSNELAANSVTASQILAGSVTTAKLDANSVTAAKIAVGTITANELAADSVTTNKIQAGAITAAKINVTNLAAIKADIGDITAGNIRSTDGSFRLDMSAAGGPYWRATNFSNMIMSGWGIGSSSQYLIWAGPYYANPNDTGVNNTNAKFYVDYAGNAYFAGTLAANIITATNIVSNSLIKSWSTVITYSVTWNNQYTPVDIISNTITTSGGPVDIDIFLNMVSSSNSSNVGFDLYRDGTLIDTNGMYMFSGTPQYQPTAFTFRETPGAGSHTYTLKGRPVGGNYTQTLNKCTMRITDNKTET